MMRLIPALLFVISINALHAQLRGPVEGFIFDSPGAGFRAVAGSLGSATLGPVVVGSLSFGSAAPGRDYGIAFQGERCLIVTGLGSEQPSTLELAGISRSPEGVAWSGDGAVAILYSRSGSWIQVVRGLPASPVAGESLSVSSLGGSLLTVAADRTGERLVVGVDGTAAGVYQIADQNFTLLPLSAANPISATFSDDGRTLYSLDSASKQIAELNWSDMSSQVWPVSGLDDPIAVRFATDAARRQALYVAGRADRMLFVYDAVTREATANVSLSSVATGIEPLGSGTFVFGFRANAEDPLWSFRASAQPAVFFVPATPAPASEDRP